MTEPLIFIFCRAGSSLLRGLFSSCGERGLLSSCEAQASRCHGAWAIGASVLPARRLSVPSGLQYLRRAGSVFHQGFSTSDMLAQCLECSGSVVAARGAQA